MTIPTVADLNEDSPAGSDNINQGDNRIREYKTQNREILEVEHDYPTSGNSATAGQHKQVTLQESDGTAQVGSSGVCVLVAQTIGGKPELVYTDEDDDDVQLTKAGVAYPSQSTVLADWATIMALVYPVGSQYVNYTVATNPETLLGIGTWVAVTEKVTVGIGGAGIFSTLTTGGAKTVDLSHDHTGTTGTKAQTSTTSEAGGTGFTNAHNHTISSDGSEAQSIVQEFRTAYVWERTV